MRSGRALEVAGGGFASGVDVEDQAGDGRGAARVALALMEVEALLEGLDRLAVFADAA